MIGVISTSLYYVIVIICFALSKIYSAGNSVSKKSEKKLSLILVCIFSVLFTLFNIFCTSNELEWRGDRLQYYRDFNGRKINSYLSLIIDFINSKSGSFELLLYSTTFICCILIFTAYRNSKCADSYSLLAFLCTDTILYSYMRLKQAYAIAIATLLFSILLNNKITIKRAIIGMILLYIICGFHASGYLMVPLFLFILLFKERKINIYLVFAIIIIMFTFFQPLLISIAKVFEPYLPELASKINEYFSDDSLGIGDGTLLYFIKGMPYYIFFFIGIFCRKRYSDRIPNYDIYLVILLCCSLSYIISLWSYWMKRTAPYFVFSSIEFGVLLIKNLENDKLKKYLYGAIIFTFAFLLTRYFYISFHNYGCLV